MNGSFALIFWVFFLLVSKFLSTCLELFLALLSLVEFKVKDDIFIAIHFAEDFFIDSKKGHRVNGVSSPSVYKISQSFIKLDEASLWSAQKSTKDIIPPKDSSSSWLAELQPGKQIFYIWGGRPFPGKSHFVRVVTPLPAPLSVPHVY
jgi:hypothetical protein